MQKIYRAPGAGGQHQRQQHQCAAKKKKKKKTHQPAPPQQERTPEDQTQHRTKGRQAPPPQPEQPAIPPIMAQPVAPQATGPAALNVQIVDPTAAPEEQEEQEEREALIAEKMGDFDELEDYEEQIAFFHECLEQQLIDGEAALEMLEVLYEPSMRRGERERFDALIQELRARAPAAYAEEIMSMLEWRVTQTVVLQRTSALEPLLQELAWSAGTNPQPVLRILDPLIYRGYTDPCFQTLKQAWPAMVKGLKQQEYDMMDEGLDEEDEDEDWFYHEILEMGHSIIPIAVFAYLEQNQTLPVNKPLLERYIQTILPAPPEYFEGFITLMLNPESFQSTLDDFAPDLWDYADEEGGEEDEDAHRERPPARTKLTDLTFVFLGHLHRDGGMAYTKAEMARNQLEHYLVQRQAGVLDSSVGGGFFGQFLSPIKSKEEREPPDHMLCPDKYTLNRFIQNITGPLFTSNYYHLAAFLECLPSWLDFLEARNLLDTQRHTDTLEDLREVLDETAFIWADFYDDPLPREQVVRVWGLPETWGQSTDAAFKDDDDDEFDDDE
jgi:hypothetical protein